MALNGDEGAEMVASRTRLGAGDAPCFIHASTFGMFDQLTIFGAGLIGGSIALAARERGLAKRLVAVNTDGGARYSQSERERFADEWVRASDSVRLEAVYAGSDLVVLTSPVHSIIREMPRALASGAIVTDAGSTKVAICEAARLLPHAGHFVPSHPMAGHPEGGLEHARADLFVGRSWLVCPEGSAVAAVAMVSAFAGAIGARVIELSAHDHDRSVAITSHLPQILASALASMGKERGADIAAGPGFASATRVAGGADAMWRDIFATNGAAIAAALGDLEEELAKVREGLTEGNLAPALDLLARARRSRQGDEKG